MPAIPSSSAPGAGSSTSSNTASNSGGNGGDAFGKLLQGSAGKEPAATGKGSAKNAANGRVGNAPAGDARTPASTPAATDGSTPGTASSDATPTPSSTGTSRPNGDKDTAPETDSDAAPWPPLGLAGLVLATAVPAEPAAPTPVVPDDAEGAALPATPALAPALTAGPATPAATTLGASAAATATTAAPAEDAPATAAALAALLPARGAGDGKQDDGLDLSTLAPPPLQGTSPTHDLRSAVANAAAFAADPTPTPVLGDEGFDQAIGARVGWLADQKIGHAHIRLSPDELGAVDVRLQLNGDKVHASFSSPHVDVRQALESSLPRLRELLGEQGFQLAHADVSQQPASGQGDGAAGRGQGRGDGGDGEPSHGETVLPAAQLIRQRGLLDAYA